MKVITEYPIMVNRNVVSKGAWSRFDDETFSYLTSKSPVNQIKAFQDWMDIKYPGWVKGKNLNKGSGYGNFGPSTEAAWKKYGKEFVAGAPIVDLTMGGGSSSGSVKQPTQAQKDEAKKKGLTWDETKGRWQQANEALGILTQTIGGIKGLFGKGGAAPVESATAPSAEPEAPKKSNLPLIIGVGVAAVIIIAVVVMKNKKK
jgi:hypothetical protein